MIFRYILHNIILYGLDHILMLVEPEISSDIWNIVTVNSILQSVFLYCSEGDLLLCIENILISLAVCFQLMRFEQRFINLKCIGTGIVYILFSYYQYLIYTIKVNLDCISLVITRIKMYIILYRC